MTREIVSVRLDARFIQLIDRAVKRGIYPSRSEAIRSIVVHFVRERSEAFEDPFLSRLLRQSALPDDLFAQVAAEALAGKETAADRVAGGRRRE